MEVEQKWKKYETLLHKCNSEAINKFLDEQGQRIVECPYGMRDTDLGAHPCGLVDNALDVTATMLKVASALDLKLDKKSVIKVGMLHDIGRIGDLEHDYLSIEKEQWKINRGQIYGYNEDCRKMQLHHRTLYLLQHYNIVLTTEEYIAVCIARGQYIDENKFYIGSEPTLALLLQQAKQLVLNKAKNNK
jgi:hypothetical protein